MSLHCSRVASWRIQRKDFDRLRGPGKTREFLEEVFKRAPVGQAAQGGGTGAPGKTAFEYAKEDAEELITAVEGGAGLDAATANATDSILEAQLAAENPGWANKPEAWKRKARIRKMRDRLNKQDPNGKAGDQFVKDLQAAQKNSGKKDVMELPDRRNRPTSRYGAPAEPPDLGAAAGRVGRAYRGLIEGGLRNLLPGGGSIGVELPNPVEAVRGAVRGVNRWANDAQEQNRRAIQSQLRTVEEDAATGLNATGADETQVMYSAATETETVTVTAPAPAPEPEPAPAPTAEGAPAPAGPPPTAPETSVNTGPEPVPPPAGATGIAQMAGVDAGPGEPAPVRNYNNRSVRALTEIAAGRQKLTAQTPDLPQAEASAPAQYLSQDVRNPNHRWSMVQVAMQNYKLKNYKGPSAWTPTFSNPLGGQTRPGMGGAPARINAVVTSFEQSGNGQGGFDMSFNDGQFRALMPGRVKDINFQGSGNGASGNGYGNYVVVESIDPVNGQSVDVLYAHLGNARGQGINVRIGQMINAGDILGLQGSTGRVLSQSGTIASVDFLAPAPMGSGSQVPYQYVERLRKQVADAIGQGMTLGGARANQGFADSGMSQSKVYPTTCTNTPSTSVSWNQITPGDETRTQRWMDPTLRDSSNSMTSPSVMESRWALGTSATGS